MNCDKYTSWTSLINSLSGNGYIKCTNKFLPKGSKNTVIPNSNSSQPPLQPPFQPPLQPTPLPTPLNPSQPTPSSNSSTSQPNVNTTDPLAAQINDIINKKIKDKQELTNFFNSNKNDLLTHSNYKELNDYLDKLGPEYEDLSDLLF